MGKKIDEIFRSRCFHSMRPAFFRKRSNLRKSCRGGEVRYLAWCRVYGGTRGVLRSYRGCAAKFETSYRAEHKSARRETMPFASYVTQPFGSRQYGPLATSQCHSSSNAMYAKNVFNDREIAGITPPFGLLSLSHALPRCCLYRHGRTLRTSSLQ